MKLFKTVDEKLAEIGFTKEKEDKYGVCIKEKIRNIILHKKLSLNTKNLVDIFYSHMIQI